MVFSAYMTRESNPDTIGLLGEQNFTTELKTEICLASFKKEKKSL